MSGLSSLNARGGIRPYTSLILFFVGAIDIGCAVPRQEETAWSLGQEFLKLSADIDVVAKNGRYAGYFANALRLCRGTTPDDNDGDPSAVGQPPYDLAAFPGGGGGDRAGVDDRQRVRVGSIRGAQTRSFQNAAKKLGFVLVDFTAKSGK